MTLAEELDFDDPVLSCMRRSYIGMPILKLWILLTLSVHAQRGLL